MEWNVNAARNEYKFSIRKHQLIHSPAPWVRVLEKLIVP
jgi:hypothetical protein